MMNIIKDSYKDLVTNKKNGPYITKTGQNKWPEKITLIFGIVTFSFIVLQIIILTSANSLLSGNSEFIRLFDLNREKNAPSLFSSFQLLFSGAILLMIGLKEKDNKRYYWILLSFIFFGLSCDELLSFHERLIKPLRLYLKVSGYLYFAWVIPYGLAAMFIGLFFLHLLNKLPGKTKRLILISGVIYVTGAWGFELLGGNQYVSDGEIQTQAFRILYTIEESFEMIGINLFVYTLMDYQRRLSLSAPTTAVADLDNFVINGYKENDSRKTGTLL